jgi:serine phosphatase RsbU (regulator of sigma subunit)
MPLGLIEIVSYEQTSLEMQVGDIAVLLTDGIAEAQNQERVLLGFPRIESLLREGATAKNLVETAQQHGQNDDLTVLSIAREA